MVHIHTAALLALAPLLAQAHQAQHEIDDAEVAAQNGNDEFERGEVHGRLSDVGVVECVSAGRDDVAGQDADDEQDDQCKAELRVEREGVPEGGHGSCLTRSASLHERFESHLAFGEVAHGKHELRWHPVISHLRDAARRDTEGISERFGSAALTFEPSFEIHGASLEQPKRLRQAFSKPCLFKLD